MQWGRPGFHPWVGKIPWRREQLPTQVFHPGEFHGLYNFHFTFLILHNNKEPFLDRTVTCNKKWIFFFGLSPLSWTEMLWKYLPKPHLHQKKAMVTVLWSAVSLTHYSFLNPGKTITSEKYAQQICQMHWTLQCLQPELVNRMGPILLQDNAWLTACCTNNASELEQTGLQSFALSAIFTWTLTNWYFFKHLNNFLQG